MSGQQDASTPLLEFRGVHAGYGSTTILRDINLTAKPGQVMALIGPNGAGKTTLLRVASGLLRARSGEILVAGEDARRQTPAQRARAGVCLIPEGRGIFPALTVRENLVMQIPPWQRPGGIDRALGVFPGLRDRLNAHAGSLSGGQQQLLALCRCFLTAPQLILLDEVSMGLAPKVIDQIFDSLKALAGLGAGMLLVEQYVDRALDIADRVVLISRGQITFDLPSGEVDRKSLAREYLHTPATKQN
jgi:branched-chain amino acid transport system ATP-binding protein